MMVNVFTAYDETKTVIARIRPDEHHRISERTYKRILKERTIGGCAGIYTDADFEIDVIGKYGQVVAFIDKQQPSGSGKSTAERINIMKLKETNWTYVRLDDRTILKKDLPLLNKEQREALGNLDVIKIEGTRYKAI